MSLKQIFVVTGKDRHCDLQVELFGTFGLAKKYCENWLKIVHGDIEESGIDGLSYEACYGESDSVKIELKTIQE